ncbi:hypothetical protein BKA81DRAFT_409546 [Phyllosticta paracitricarpa]
MTDDSPLSHLVSVDWSIANHLLMPTVRVTGPIGQRSRIDNSNFYAYWSLGHVLEAAFEIKEKDTDKFVAYCTGKVPSSISPPPDNQPSSLGNCVSLDRESTISATVGGDPGTNLLIYVKDDKSIPCGPQTQYEGTTSVSAASYYCQNLEQNGNSAQCNQKKDAAVDLIMNKYVAGKAGQLQPRHAQGTRC